jgi:calcineurin-like phosphoesterase family protein
MTVWFTADTHFNHRRTLELSKRPFKNVNEMNNVMIKNWNRVVGKHDTVIHLGDFGDYEFSHKLNGQIVLLFGNYERKDVEQGIITKDDLINKYNFIIVHDDKMMLYRGLDETFYLVHEPLHMKLDEFYLFGHIHKLQMVKRKGLNVGVDCHNFAPIDLETVKFYKNAILNHYDENVFCQ